MAGVRGKDEIKKYLQFDMDFYTKGTLGLHLDSPNKDFGLPNICDFQNYDLAFVIRDSSFCSRASLLVMVHQYSPTHRNSPLNLTELLMTVLDDTFFQLYFT